MAGGHGKGVIQTPFALFPLFATAAATINRNQSHKSKTEKATKRHRARTQQLMTFGGGGNWPKTKALTCVHLDQMMIFFNEMGL